jgi:hypothetical protein
MSKLNVILVLLKILQSELSKQAQKTKFGLEFSNLCTILELKVMEDKLQSKAKTTISML